jgi:hypothetical protein
MKGPLGVMLRVPQAEKPALGLGPLGRIKPIPLTPYDEEDEVARLRESIGLPPEPPIKRRTVASATPAPAPAPVSRSKEWRDPEKKAERARRRAEWASARIKQGQDEAETRRRATEAAYREAVKSE